MEDEDGAERFMANNDEETFWALEENDAFIARKVSGRNFRFKKRRGKGKSGSKKGVANEVADKDQSQKNTSTETKKRRRSTDRDDDDEPGMEPARERVVKHRVTMEKLNQQVYLNREMSKPEAEEKLKIIKESFRDMQRYEKNPQKVHKDLNQCEIDS